MIAKKSVLGLVHTGSEVRRAPLIGMEFLHEPTVRTADLVTPRARLQAKDLISLLRRHFATRRRTAILAATPACPLALRVLTPGGLAGDNSGRCECNGRQQYYYSAASASASSAGFSSA